jgi:hypothetical protein
VPARRPALAQQGRGRVGEAMSEQFYIALFALYGGIAAVFVALWISTLYWQRRAAKFERLYLNAMQEWKESHERLGTALREAFPERFVGSLGPQGQRDE